MKNSLHKAIAFGVITALFALVVEAPLFHFHAGDDHERAVIHAHLPELEHELDEHVVHMEEPHGHGEARSVDVLLATTVHAPHLDLIISASPAELSRPEICCGFVSTTVPTAHAPPSVFSGIPRSPPSEISS